MVKMKIYDFLNDESYIDFNSGIIGNKEVYFYEGENPTQTDIFPSKWEKYRKLNILQKSPLYVVRKAHSYANNNRVKDKNIEYHVFESPQAALTYWTNTVKSFSFDNNDLNQNTSFVFYHGYLSKSSYDILPLTLDPLKNYIEVIDWQNFKYEDEIMEVSRAPWVIVNLDEIK